MSSAFALRGTKKLSSGYDVVSQTDRTATSRYHSSDDEDDVFEDEFLSKVEDPLERDARDAVTEGIFLKKLAVALPALTTIGVNVVAMISGESILVIAAGAIAALVSCAVLIMEISMEDLESCRAKYNAAYASVVRQARKRNHLYQKRNEMQIKVFCLKEDERRLIAEMNDPHKGRIYLRGVVEKVKAQVGEKSDAYHQYILTDLMNLVIRADKDESGKFDDREIKHLIRYIKELPSISVNEKKLSKAIKKDRSLAGVLGLVQELGRKDIPAKKRIFTFDEKQIEMQLVAMQKKHESTSSSSKKSTGETKNKKKTSGDDTSDAGGSKKKKGTTKKKKKQEGARSSRSLSPTRSKTSRSKSPTTRRMKEGRADFQHPMLDSTREEGSRGRSRSPPRSSAPERKVGRRSQSFSPLTETKLKKLNFKGVNLKKLAPLNLKQLVPKKKKGKGDSDFDTKSGFF